MIRFFINLDRSKDRLSSLQKQFENLNIDFIRIPAIDGSQLDATYIQSLQAPYEKNLILSPLSSGEIGCFLSHRSCWQKFLETDEEWAFIIEDDVIISNNAKQFLINHNWIPNNINIIHASLIKNPCEARIYHYKYTLNNNYFLCRNLYPQIYGTQGYFISRKAAQFALEITNQYLSNAVDDFLFGPYYKFYKQFPFWKLNPSIILSSELESLIDASRKNKIYCKKKYIPLRLKIYREIIRKSILIRKKFSAKEQYFFK